MRRRSEAGFTLIETIVAVAITTIAVTMVWGSFWGVMRTKERIESVEARTREIRMAMGRMVRDLSHAFISENRDLAAIDRPTFFIGDHHLGSDQVSFSYMGHVKLRAGADEAETAVVTYFVDSDPKDASRQNLFRRETRRIGGEDPRESGATFTVCEDVQGLRLEYFDELQDEWRDEWDTVNADGQQLRLPNRVRIALTVRDERDREISFLTEARVFLQDALYF